MDSSGKDQKQLSPRKESTGNVSEHICMPQAMQNHLLFRELGINKQMGTISLDIFFLPVHYFKRLVNRHWGQIQYIKLLLKIAPEESRDWLLDDNIQQQFCIFTKQHQIDLGKTYVAATDLF